MQRSPATYPSPATRASYPFPASALRVLPALLCVSLALLPLSKAAAGEETAGSAPAMSSLEAGAWARADAVVHMRVGTVTDVRSPGGTKGRQVVNGSVLASYKGGLKMGAPVSVIVLGQRPTLDPSRPSVPYFVRGKRSTHVLFLNRSPKGHAWRLLTLYDTDGRGGRERVAAVVAVAGWVRIKDTETKAHQVVKDLLRMLASGGTWTKTHAAREIAWLAEQRPESFTAKQEQTLRRIAPMGSSRDQRRWTRRALQALGTRDRSRRKAARGEEDPWRRRFLATSKAADRKAMLSGLAATNDASFASHAWWAWRRMDSTLRVWFLDVLAIGRRTREAAAVRAAYGSEDDPVVRDRIVRTLGFVGGDADVPWLVQRTQAVRLRRTALLALARIRSPLALGQLRGARAATWANEDLKGWIDHLLSAEFDAKAK